ncbi:MAG TPA: hypothetical protein VGF06_11830 [Terriglobales bacterium]
MVRCPQCGYKNSPLYHYCGECGAVLPGATPEAGSRDEAPASSEVQPRREAPFSSRPMEPSARPSAPAPIPRSEPSAPSYSRREPETPVTGMSFLGLSDSGRSSGYLLEDEEEPRPWGKILLVIILLGVGGAAAWQWHVGGYPFDRLAQPSATQSPSPAAPSPSPAPAPPSQSVTPSTAAPAPAPGTEAPPAANSPAKTEGQNATATPSSGPQAAEPSAAKNEAPAPEKDASQKTAEESEKTPTPAATEKPAKAAVPHPKPAPPAEPQVSAGEALFAQGQKYLYGKGVDENCALAVRSFQAAADHDHVQAESTLGVMYFTGHCVNRDLPSAYRWFARALHQDPTNSRLEQNLRSVWSAMTPEERQAATRSE